MNPIYAEMFGTDCDLSGAKRAIKRTFVSAKTGHAATWTHAVPGLPADGDLSDAGYAGHCDTIVTATVGVKSTDGDKGVRVTGRHVAVLLRTTSRDVPIVIGKPVVAAPAVDPATVPDGIAKRGKLVPVNGAK